MLRLAFGLLYWNGRPLTHDEREIPRARGEHLGRQRVRLRLRARVRDGAAVRTRARLSLVSRSNRRWPRRCRCNTTDGQDCPGDRRGGRRLADRVARASQRRRARRHRRRGSCGHLPLTRVDALLRVRARPSIPRSPSAARWCCRTACLPRRDAAGDARTVSAGLLAAAGALVRPAMLLLLPIAAAWLFATHRHRLAIAFVLAGVAANRALDDSKHPRVPPFVLIASEGGVTFWTGTIRSPSATATWPRIRRSSWRRLSSGARTPA